MAVKVRMSDEELLEGIKQTYQSVRMYKKDHKWLYLLAVLSFGFLVLLNFTLPDVYLIEKKPVYNVNDGLIGLVLTVFGITFFLNAIFFRNIGKESIIFYTFTWFIGAIISICFLYFGLPLFLGFQW